ncbi:hypothetical protein ACWD48_19430 [Streptomyces sp. NPDC002519]
MPDAVLRVLQDDEPVPLWLSPWPFREPQYPDLPGGYADETE